MSENINNIEMVNKKLENLDSELNSFIHSIREIKQIRESVGSLPEKLKQSGEEIENQKKNLEHLVSSSNNLIMTFQEEAKGIIFDIEKKSESLTTEVKAGLSKIGSIIHQCNSQLENEHVEQIKEVTEKLEKLETSFDTVRKITDLHQQSISKLKNNYVNLLPVLENLDNSNNELKQYISGIQKGNLEPEKKMMELAQRLEHLINVKSFRQKMLSLSLFTVLAAGFLYFFFGFYLN